MILKTFPSATPFFHKYLIYTDSSGKEWIARGGPQYDWSIQTGWGVIDTRKGPYVDDPNESVKDDWDADRDDPVELII